jgi:hypothetical protein
MSEIIEVPKKKKEFTQEHIDIYNKIYEEITKNSKYKKKTLLYSKVNNKFYCFNKDIYRWDDGYSKLIIFILELENGDLLYKKKKLFKKLIGELKKFYDHPKLVKEMDHYTNIISFINMPEIYSLKEKKYILPNESTKVSVCGLNILPDENVKDDMFDNLIKLYIKNNKDMFYYFIYNLFVLNNMIIIFKNPPEFLSQILSILLNDLYLNINVESKIITDDKNQFVNPFTSSITKFYKLIWVDIIEENIEKLIPKIKKINNNFILSVKTQKKVINIPSDIPHVLFEEIDEQFTYEEIRNYAVSILNKTMNNDYDDTKK